MTIAAQLQTVQTRIRQAEIATHRPANSVKLLAVSKLQDSFKIREAWIAGQQAFGESYLQEAIEKQTTLQDLQQELEWHFIGRIQSNKTKAIAERFAWVHGIYDYHHAKRLNAQRPNMLPALNICIQVNISKESSKNGLAPEAVLPLLEQCLELPRLQLKGLMAIPEPTLDPNKQHQAFAQLRHLRDTLATKTYLPLETLSMGMSDDLEAAIAEGATIVRVGTAIFGPRHTGNQ
ncbi:YggS family pyridoxal phosphate enzyme [Achromatium sp. WMS3]|nr:YggS family pyridoxal phosphate enzyme [Achromatium sp. WMS3]